MTKENEVITATPIAVFNEFRSQLAELIDNNKKAVFDYEDAAGNKAARSHVHKLRLSKGVIEALRKKEKAESLAYGKRVDTEAAEISDQIQGMIDVHADIIKEIEEREKQRIKDIEGRMWRLQAACNIPHNADAAALKVMLKHLESIPVDATWQEFEDDATAEKSAGLLALNESIEKQEQHDKEQAELAVLRKEKADRDQADRDAEIARQAAADERERVEREAKAEQDRIEKAAQAEQDRLREVAEKAERDRKQALADKKTAEDRAALAELEREQAAKRERNRIAAEQDAQKKAAEEERERRERNTRHKGKVNREAAAALLNRCGLSEADAKKVVTAIAQGKIPAVTITY